MKVTYDEVIQAIRDKKLSWLTTHHGPWVDELGTVMEGPHYRATWRENAGDRSLVLSPAQKTNLVSQHGLDVRDYAEEECIEVATRGD